MTENVAQQIANGFQKLTQVMEERLDKIQQSLNGIQRAVNGVVQELRAERTKEDREALKKRQQSSGAGRGGRGVR